MTCLDPKQGWTAQASIWPYGWDIWVGWGRGESSNRRTKRSWIPKYCVLVVMGPNINLQKVWAGFNNWHQGEEDFICLLAICFNVPRYLVNKNNTEVLLTEQKSSWKERGEFLGSSNLIIFATCVGVSGVLETWRDSLLAKFLSENKKVKLWH